MTDRSTRNIVPEASEDSFEGADMDLARHLADIASVLLAPGGETTAADTILSLAVSTMDSCDEAGLCSDSGLTVQASPSELMTLLDAAQAQAGHGPCTEALAGLDALYVPDLLDDHRWPQFSLAAVGLACARANPA